MREVGFIGLLDGHSADLALFSTFNFDPDYFERRVLPSSRVNRARRIIVFMDAGQWNLLRAVHFPARLLNNRYLVIPILGPRGGVFHPKVSLLLAADEARFICGSNNLTRSGCSSNLELINTVVGNAAATNPHASQLISDAFAFFQSIVMECDGLTGRIAREWIKEQEERTPWATASYASPEPAKVRFLHTYQRSIWTFLRRQLDGDPPDMFQIISPYYDSDAAFVKRLADTWPRCRIELIVQQSTTNLNLSPLRGLQKRLSLYQLKENGRRIHAKLVAWRTNRRVGCLAGSANCTEAAFDSRNVEACMYLADAKEHVEALFEGRHAKVGLKKEDFIPGDEPPPAGISQPELLVLDSAVLIEDGGIQIQYRSTLPKKDRQRGAIEFRIPGEPLPRASLPVSIENRGETVLRLEANPLQDVSGTLLAQLIAEGDGTRHVSLPIWVVQKGRLTIEPTSDSSSRPTAKIESSGEGLLEFLEEIGKRDGVTAVIEYLKRLNIRFYDGGDSGRVPRPFRPRIRDPFRSDMLPDWLVKSLRDNETLLEAILDFVDRHEHQRLRRHGERGNINGLENFLDVLSALVRLLFVYYERGVVPRGHLISRYVRYIGIATTGIDEEDDHASGYLQNIQANLKGGEPYLRKVVIDLTFFAHLLAILVIAQKVRFGAERTAGRARMPAELLPTSSDRILQMEGSIGTVAVMQQEVSAALRSYNMLSDQAVLELSEQATPLARPQFKSSR